MRRTLPPIGGGAVQEVAGQAPRSVLRAWVAREHFLGPLMLAPAVLYIVLLVGGPLLFAIYLSMSNATTGSQTLDFVGPANFIRAVDNTIFRTALANTFIIPIIPFFFMRGTPAIAASFVISTLAHFMVGAAKTIVTGLSPWRSGSEMTVVGLGEALITYGLGLIVGPIVG